MTETKPQLAAIAATPAFQSRTGADASRAGDRLALGVVGGLPAGVRLNGA
jgi:hypothetical protein